MIRSLVVIVGLIVGWSFAVRGPLYAAAFYLWIAYFRPESWAWSGIFAAMDLSYYAGAFLLLRTLVSSAKLRLDIRNGLLFLFLAQGLIASLYGHNTMHSLGYLQEFAKTIVVSYLLTVLITTAAEFRIVITVIALSLGFDATIQGWATLLLNPGAPNINSVPFLGDNNLVAVGMAMLLPTIGALGATASGWQKRAFQFMSVGVLYRAISTYSRGGMLSIAAVGVMYFWRSQHKIRTVAAFLIVLVLVLPALPQEYWDRMSTINAPDEERDRSQTGRLHFWQVGIEMANNRPFIGVGHNGYYLAYDYYDFLDGGHGRSRAVHSAWFGVLAEYGYPGLVIFLAVLASSLRACRRIRQSSKRGEVSAELGAYASGLESAMVAFMVGGSFVSFHYSEMLWHFFALTMALEAVVVKEVAAAKARVAAKPEPGPMQPLPSQPREPDFVWG